MSFGFGNGGNGHTLLPDRAVPSLDTVVGATFHTTTFESVFHGNAFELIVFIRFHKFAFSVGCVNSSSNLADKS